MRGTRNILFLTALVSIVWLDTAHLWAAEPTRVIEHEGSWILENSRLRVAVDPTEGSIRIVDRQAGREWRQPKSSTPFGNVRRKPEDRSVWYLRPTSVGTTSGPSSALR